MRAQGQTSAFGKIGTQGDFLRINFTDPAAPELVRFLEDGNELLHVAGARLDSKPIRFVFAPPSKKGVLLGALAPGVDAVGRTFPLALFAPLNLGDVREAFPLVPALYRTFLEGAEALLAEAKALKASQIAERLPQPQMPRPSEVATAQSIAREASTERAKDLQQRLFGDLGAGQRYYAFRTFQLACQPVRGRDLALDCPCGRESDVSIWLDLARRLLHASGPPSFFWRAGAHPALVIALGAPVPGILPYLTQPTRASAKIWPLNTQQPSAIVAAQKTLSASHLTAIDRSEGTVGDLIAALSRS